MDASLVYFSSEDIVSLGNIRNLAVNIERWAKPVKSKKGDLGSYDKSLFYTSLNEISYFCCKIFETKIIC